MHLDKCEQPSINNCSAFRMDSFVCILFSILYGSNCDVH